MVAAWWTFPRIDNFGTIDPEGNYWKPDSNIQLPGNYPIGAILPGTVTDVAHTSYGQEMVTIKLDNPLNSLATHTFYEHMSSSTVSVGQHVNTGTLIGYNNPAGTVPLGFGLYSGDHYGVDPGWSILQKDLCPGCANMLNPVRLLDAFKAGKGVPTSYGGSSSGTGSTSGSGSVPAPPIAGSVFFAQIGQKIGLFLLSIVLVAVGMYLTFEKQVKSVASKAAKVAEVAAL